MIAEIKLFVYKREKKVTRSCKTNHLAAYVELFIIGDRLLILILFLH